MSDYLSVQSQNPSSPETLIKELSTLQEVRKSRAWRLKTLNDAPLQSQHLSPLDLDQTADFATLKANLTKLNDDIAATVIGKRNDQPGPQLQSEVATIPRQLQECVSSTVVFVTQLCSHVSSPFRIYSAPKVRYQAYIALIVLTPCI